LEHVRKFVPEEEEQKIDLNAYWKIFWRKKFYLIVPLILSIVIAVFGVGKITPVYQSSTLLSIENQNILSRTVEQIVSPVEDRTRDRDRQYKAMIETKVKSRSFLELVAKDLGLHRSHNVRQLFEASHDPASDISADERMMRYLVRVLRDKISVQNPISGFFSISVLDTDPTTCYILAKRVSDKYIEVTKLAQIQGIRQAGAFSDEQLAIYREKLETSEKALSDIRREMREADVEGNPVNAENVHVAEARKRSISANIANSNLTLKRVRERLTAIFGLVPSTDKIYEDETISSIEQRIFAYAEEKMLYELNLQENVEIDPPTMLWEDLRSRISEIVNSEYQEFSRDLRPLITEYFYQRLQLDYFSAAERTLQSYIDQFKSNVEREPILQREYDRLSHEVEVNRAIYQTFINSKTSAQITEAAQSTNLGMRTNIIEEAQKPYVPVKPDKIKVILVAIMFGAACGIGAILVTEYIDDSFRTVDEVQRVLRVPVLGTIPKTIDNFKWERERKGKAITIWIIGIILFTAAVGGSLFIYAKTLGGSSIGIELKQETGERRQ